MEWRECRVDPLPAHVPRRRLAGRLVRPFEFVAPICQAAVDEYAILGHTGSVGPLAAHLQSEAFAVCDARAGGPVPRHGVRPLAATAVEDRKRVPRVEIVGGAVDRDRAGHRTRHILERVLETALRAIQLTGPMCWRLRAMGGLR